ncbi:MAG: hypothetical protein AAF922_18025 [Pseudomonadota bacterium]
MAARELSKGNVIVACQQERNRFEAPAEEIEADVAGFVDLRDRAGWSEDETGPKMAALTAEAALTLPVGKSIDVVSEGTCLIIGEHEAIRAAEMLCNTLAVTVLLSNSDGMPTDRRYDCVVGAVNQLVGALGILLFVSTDFSRSCPPAAVSLPSRLRDRTLYLSVTSCSICQATHPFYRPRRSVKAT